MSQPAFCADFSPTAAIKNALWEGVLVGAASFVVGDITLVTAGIIGTTYGLISQVTRPIFDSIF